MGKAQTKIISVYMRVDSNFALFAKLGSRFYYIFQLCLLTFKKPKISRENLFERVSSPFIKLTLQNILTIFYVSNKKPRFISVLS